MDCVDTIISTLTNPFCDSYRIRLTANGQLKNCLFSSEETDLLTALRAGQPITSLIEKSIHAKLKTRRGMDTLDKFKDPSQYGKNRSMMAIGG